MQLIQNLYSINVHVQYVTEDSSNYFQPFKGYSKGKSIWVEPVTTCFEAVRMCSMDKRRENNHLSTEHPTQHLQLRSMRSSTCLVFEMSSDLNMSLVLNYNRMY